MINEMRGRLVDSPKEAVADLSPVGKSVDLQLRVVGRLRSRSRKGTDVQTCYPQVSYELGPGQKVGLPPDMDWLSTTFAAMRIARAAPLVPQNMLLKERLTLRAKLLPHRMHRAADAQVYCRL